MPAAELLLNVRGDARIAVLPSLAQTTTYVLLEQEDWFEEEIRFVRRWLKPGMRAIDVGANLGLYSAAMAKAVGRGGRVWAFEPAPVAAALLQRTIEINRCSQATLQRAAVSDASGSIRLALAERTEESAVVTAQSDPREVIEVPALTLDEAAGRLGWADIDFLKLDIEGHELPAIRGAGDFLGDGSPLVMLEIKTKGRPHLEALPALEALGYLPYRLLPGPLLLVPFDAGAIDAALLNVFACKADRARRLAADGVLIEGDAPGVPVAPGDAWAAYVQSTPYCAEMASHWRRKPGLLADMGEKSYLQALAAFALCGDGRKSAAERYGWLSRAFECAGEALASEDTLAHRMTYSRLALDLGERQIAVNSLGHALGALDGQSREAAAEPFLAPLERYERIPIGGRVGEWLRCAITEAIEKRRAYSSRFDPRTSLALLETTRDSGFVSLEMERRWQLARMALGIQAAAEPRPALCQHSDENLNPDFWSGAVPIR